MAWYRPSVTTPASGEPLTLDQAKVQTRVDGSDDDSGLAVYIAAARAHVEAYTSTSLMARTIAVKCDDFDDFAAFPVVPLISVTSIVYVDAAGADQTLSASVYEVRTDGLVASIALKPGQSWPAVQAGSRILVNAQVGYAAIPDDVKTPHVSPLPGYGTFIP